jgi:hypothetical protein
MEELTNGKGASEQNAGAGNGIFVLGVKQVGYLMD